VDLDRARKLLTAELADLDERGRQAERDRAAADVPGQEGALGQHPGDYGSEVNSAMEADLATSMVAGQRRHVLAALERIDEGTYGTCAVCGRRIDNERLNARPEAITCRVHADSATGP
jgi:RNA polymerase-binding transcription factor DksA